MKHQELLILLFLFIITPVLFSQESKPRVAVLPFEGINVSEGDAEAITALFESEVIDTNSFIMIEQQQIKEVMELQVEYSGLTGCYDEICAIELGKLLAAEYVLIGTITKLGNSYTVSVKMTDLTLGTITKSEKVTSPNLEELIDRLRILARQISGLKEASGGSGKMVLDDNESEEQAEASDENSPFPKRLISFTSEPSGVDFTVENLNGDILYSGKTPKAVSLSDAEYIIEAQDLNGLYYPFKESFNVSGNGTYSISLVPHFGSITLNTEPGGAEIWLDGMLIGETPLHIEKIKSGNYDLKIIKNLYATENLPITVRDNEDTKRSIKLKTSNVHLSINADVKSEVYIDGVIKGETPYEGEVTFSDFNLLVQPLDARYYPIEDYVNVNQIGETIVRDYELEGRYASLWVVTEPHMEGQILLNGEPAGQSPQVLTLLMGQYDIRVEGVAAGRFLIGHEKIDLKEGDEKSLTLYMSEAHYQDEIQKWIEKLTNMEAQCQTNPTPELLRQISMSLDEIKSSDYSPEGLILKGESIYNQGKVLYENQCLDALEIQLQGLLSGAKTPSDLIESAHSLFSNVSFFSEKGRNCLEIYRLLGEKYLLLIKNQQDIQYYYQKEEKTRSRKTKWGYSGIASGVLSAASAVVNVIFYNKYEDAIYHEDVQLYKTISQAGTVSTLVSGGLCLTSLVFMLSNSRDTSDVINNLHEEEAELQSSIQALLESRFSGNLTSWE